MSEFKDENTTRKNRVFATGIPERGPGRCGRDIAGRFTRAVAQMVGGPSVRGWGVPPGLVRIDSNENALGPSPRAVEAVLSLVTSINRYGAEPGPAGQTRPPARRARRRVDGQPLRPGARRVDRRRGPVRRTCSSPSATPLFVKGPRSWKACRASGFMTRFSGVANADAIRVPLLAGMKPDLDGLSAAVTDRTAMVVVTSPGQPPPAS